jgi:hypothetical protein
MKVVCNWREVHSEWLHTRAKLIGYLTCPHSQYRTTEIGSHRKSNTTKSILLVIMQQHTIQMPIWQWKDSLTKDFKEAHPKLSRYSWQGQSQTQRCNTHVQYYKTTAWPRRIVGGVWPAPTALDGLIELWDIAILVHKCSNHWPTILTILLKTSQFCWRTNKSLKSFIVSVDLI